MDKFTTRLKCKPCGLFYNDDGNVLKCENCGQKLKRIKIHNVKIKNLTIHPNSSFTGVK